MRAVARERKGATAAALRGVATGIAQAATANCCAGAGVLSAVSILRKHAVEL